MEEVGAGEGKAASGSAEPGPKQQEEEAVVDLAVAQSSAFEQNHNSASGQDKAAATPGQDAEQVEAQEGNGLGEIEATDEGEGGGEGEGEGEGDLGGEEEEAARERGGHDSTTLVSEAETESSQAPGIRAQSSLASPLLFNYEAAKLRATAGIKTCENFLDAVRQVEAIERNAARGLRRIVSSYQSYLPSGREQRTELGGDGGDLEVRELVAGALGNMKNRMEQHLEFAEVGTEGVFGCAPRMDLSRAQLYCILAPSLPLSSPPSLPDSLQQTAPATRHHRPGRVHGKGPVHRDAENHRWNLHSRPGSSATDQEVPPRARANDAGAHDKHQKRD